MAGARVEGEGPGAAPSPREDGPSEPSILVAAVRICMLVQARLTRLLVRAEETSRTRKRIEVRRADIRDIEVRRGGDVQKRPGYIGGRLERRKRRIPRYLESREVAVEGEL